MSAISKTTVKTYFETGDKPTQSQFSDFIDSTLVPRKTSISYAGTVNTDASTADIFTINLTGDTTLANPTNAVDGQSITWWIKQDGSTRVVTLGNKFSIPASATTPLAWSEGGSKMDMLSVKYDSDADKFYVIAFIPGY